MFKRIIQKKFIFLWSFFLLSITVFSQMNNNQFRAIQLFDQEQYNEAKEIFLSLWKKNKDHAVAAYYLGRIFFLDNDYDEAVDWLNKAVDLEDNHSEYYEWLGNAYGQKTLYASIIKKAILASKVKNAYLKAVEIDSTNINARDGLLKYYVMAPEVMGGSIEKAHEQARIVKVLDPLKGVFMLGYIYRNKEQYEKAIKVYQDGIKKYPKEAQLYLELGWIYIVLEKYDEAFESFETTFEIDPEKKEALYRIGQTADLAKNNLKRGEECFKQYLKKEKDKYWLSWGHYRLGNIYKHQNRLELARTEYNLALKVDPNHEQAEEALDDLD